MILLALMDYFKLRSQSELEFEDLSKETGFLGKIVAWETSDLRRNKGDGIEVRQFWNCLFNLK